MINKFIPVTIGDINGIGIELLIKLYSKKKINNFILFTNFKILKKYFIKKNYKIKIKIINNLEIKEIKNNKENSFFIFNFKSKNQIENTYLSLKYAYKYCLKNHLKGIITLPLNKEKIIKNMDKNFIGQTEYFQNLEKNKYSHMVFIKNKLIISTLTTHLPINKLIKTISKKEFIYKKIKSLNKVLINQLNIAKPKILISGFNPHAGENGTLGIEENEYIIKDIAKLKKKNIYIHGPISADAMLTKINLKNYDCFLFIFHDQALIPFKYISNYSGINFTGGLKIIRVSPDHGTAYNMVGLNLAKTDSLLNCFKFLKLKKIN